MKKYLVIFLVIVSPLYAFAQHDSIRNTSAPDTVYSNTHHSIVHPVFPGCENAENPASCFENSVRTFINQNVTYPVKAKEMGIQGRVTVGFVIEADGSVGQVHIIRGVNKSIDDEAMRAIRIMPKMRRPAMLNGKPVRVSYNQPIDFKLE